jgi:hypothetical protein
LKSSPISWFRNYLTIDFQKNLREKTEFTASFAGYKAPENDLKPKLTLLFRFLGMSTSLKGLSHEMDLPFDDLYGYV